MCSNHTASARAFVSKPFSFFSPVSGEVAEWLKAPHSKCDVRSDRTVGSKPTLSAHRRRLNDLGGVAERPIAPVLKTGVPDVRVPRVRIFAPSASLLQAPFVYR